MPRNSNIDAKQWLTNFSKSIAYSTKNLVSSSLMPETSQLISSAVDSAKEVRESLRETTKNIRITSRSVDQSAIGRDTRKIFNDVMKGIRTGNFSIPKDDFFGDMDIDMDFNTTEYSEEDGSTTQVVEVSNDAKLTSAAVIESGNMTAEAISSMTKSLLSMNAKTAKAQTKAMQNMAVLVISNLGGQIAGTNKRLDTLNLTTSNILRFLVENQAKVNAKMMEHFARSEELAVLQTRILLGDPKKKELSISEDLRKNGWDFAKFAKLVKKNYSNSSAGMMIDMLKSGAGMMGSMASMGAFNPLDSALQAIIGGVMGKNTKKAIQNLDKNIPVMLGNLFGNLGNKKNAPGMLGVLAELFGYDQSKIGKLNLGNYKKDAVAWDGYSKRALEEVIPHYLAQIAAGVRGAKDIEVYDYKSGRFKRSSQAIHDARDSMLGELQSTFFPILDRMDQMLKDNEGNYRGDPAKIQKAENEFKADFGKYISEMLKSDADSNDENRSKRQKEATEKLKNSMGRIYGKNGLNAFTQSQAENIYQEILSALEETRSRSRNASIRYNTTDNSYIRELQNSGLLKLKQDEDGMIDIISSFATDDMLNKQTEYTKRYQRQLKLMQEKRERAEAVIKDAVEKGKTSRFKKVIDFAEKVKNEMKSKIEGGGSRDEALANAITRLTNSGLALSHMDASDLDALWKASFSGKDPLKNKIRKFAGSVSKSSIGNQFGIGIHLNSAKRMMDKAQLELKYYTFRSYGDDTENPYFYMAYLQEMPSNPSPKWKTYPKVITADMFVNGKLDIDKVLQNPENVEVKVSNPGVATFKDDNAAIRKNIIKVRGNFNKASSSQITAQMAQKYMSKRVQNGRSQSHSNQAAVSVASEASSSDDGGGSEDGPASSAQFAPGIAKIKDSFVEVSNDIRQKGARIVDSLFGENPEEVVQENIQEMQDATQAMEKTDRSFGPKTGKSFLKIALGALVGGFVGKKLFSRKGLNVLAAATSIAGPIGFAMVGLGAGILATKIDFRRMLLGEENTDANGNLKKRRKGPSFIQRIWNGFKVNVLDEMKVGVKGFLGEMGAFAKKQLAAPLKRAFTPLAKGADVVGDAIKGGISGLFGRIGDKVKGTASKIVTATNFSGVGRLIQAGFAGARSSTGWNLRAAGALARGLSSRRKRRDYQKMGGSRKLGRTLMRANSARVQTLMDQIFEIAGDNPSEEDLRNAYEIVTTDPNNEIDTSTPLGQALMADLEEQFNQYLNDINYKTAKQKRKDDRTYQSYRRKAFGKTGNDIFSMSDKQYQKFVKKLDRTSIANDELYQRAKGSKEDFMEYMNDRDKFAKIIKARDDTERQQAEAETEKKKLWSWRTGILSVAQAILNRVSFGNFKPKNSENPDDVANEAKSVTVDEKKYAEENAAGQAVIQENDQKMLDKQTAEETRATIEGIESDSTQSQGAKGSRKGGFTRKIRSIFGDSDDNTSEAKDGEEEGGGLLSTIIGGVKSLFSNPLLIAGVGAAVDLMFNNGQVTEFLMGALGNLIKGAANFLWNGAKSIGKKVVDAINPFKRTSDAVITQDQIRDADGNVVGADQVEGLVDNGDGTYSIAKSQNPVGNMLVSTATRAMTKVNANTLGGAVKQIGSIAGSEIKTGLKTAGKGAVAAGKATYKTAKFANKVLHPVRTIRKWATKKVGQAAKWVGGKAKSGIQNLGSKAVAGIKSKLGIAAAQNADDVLLKGAEELSEQAAKEAAGAAGKAALKETAVDGAKTKGLKAVWNKLIELFNKVLDKLKSNKTVAKLVDGGKSGAEKLVDTIKDKLLKVAQKADDKIFMKFGVKLSAAGAKLGSDIANFIPIVGQVLMVGEAIWNGISGAMEAANLFQVNESDVDGWMRAVSSILKILWGLVPFGWLVPLISEIIQAITGWDFQTWLAGIAYDFLAGSKIDPETGKTYSQKLDEAQNSFDEEFKKYNQETGQNLSKDDYNNMQNASLGKRISNSISSWWEGEHWWDSYETKLQKRVKKAAGEYGVNSQEYKDAVKNYESETGKSVSEFMGEGYGPGPKRNVGYGGFLQNDPRWGKMRLGRFRNGEVATMDRAGCGFAAMADVDNLLGGNSTPADVARKAMSRGDVADGGATASLFERGMNGVKGTRIKDPYAFVDSLKNGNPVVVSGQAGYGPGPSIFPRNNKHLVVAKSIDENGNVTVENPMYGTQIVPFEKLSSQTKNAWSMHKTSPSGYGPVSLTEGNAASTFYSSPDTSGGAKEMKYYSQWNGPWSGLKMGSSDIYHIGCVLTSAAMALTNLLDKDINPAVLHGTIAGTLSGDGGVTGSTWNTIKNTYGITTTEYPGGDYRGGSSQDAWNKAKVDLSKGIPVALHGNSNTNMTYSYDQKSGHSYHNILAIGKTNDGRIAFLDPSDSTPNRDRGAKRIGVLPESAFANGLVWARPYSVNGQGIAGNSSIDASSLTNSVTTGSSGSSASNGSNSAVSADSQESSLSIGDIFSKLGSGLTAIANNAISAIIGGKDYERALDDSGEPITTEGISDEGDIQEPPTDGSSGYGSGPRSAVLKRYPTGYGTFAEPAGNGTEGIETRLDTLIDLVSVIANKDSGSSGYGSGPAKTNAGYGRYSSGTSAKDSIKELNDKKLMKSIKQNTQDRNSTSTNDLGRSRLLAIHRAIASGYRGVTK